MATPPAEAPSDLKEEKPQLPPSPNGAASTDAVPGAQNTDAKPDVPTSGATQNGVAKPDTMNGQPPEQPSLSNGVNATASPKSPAPAAADTSTQPHSPEPTAPQTTPPADDSKPSNMETTAAAITATDETKKELDQEKPAAEQPALQTKITNDIGADHATPQETPAPQEAPKPPTESADVKVKNAHTPSDPAVKTELPHHPHTAVKPEDAPVDQPPAPPSQTNDQEMWDAPEPPSSPAKIPREREPDVADEPAAKRTKIDNEGAAQAPADTGAANLPTPATEASTAPRTSEEQKMSKVQHKFLLKGIQSLKRMNDSRFYREPVDPVKLNIPHYPQIITRPMDLGTIERRLKQNEYSTSQAVLDDFYLMVHNALVFNGPDHLVAQEGQKLKATFDKQMVNLPRPDQVEEKKSKKASPKANARQRNSQPGARPAAGSPQATTFALGPEGLPLIRRDSSTADGRPKRSIHPPKRDLPYSTKPKKKKFQWELKFCQEVLEELHKPKHYAYAMPFYVPVDPVALNIPTYHSIIKKPMDLSTMQGKLRTGEYENSKDFEADMRLIFKNCYKFNIPGDPTYSAGQRLEEVFNGKWAQKARYLEAHEPQHEQHSVDSSDEDSDEEVEESDEDTEKLTMLQKQIAEMSRQVEAITHKKKKTPPASKKAGKSKSGKKDSKKSGTVTVGKKDKKASSKSSKPEKQRFVTYHEKQVISNGISSLPDKKMQEALKIIQSNVPALKGTQETEIELDIDELPNDVLLMLLKFVKKNAPQVMEDDDEPAPATSGTNTSAPKPKKNKPMSKFEQEAQINMLASNLSRFQGGQSPDPVPSVEANESSDDSDDDSEESEEE